jgi:tRNA pseudouridine38-40 synthase
VAPGESAHLLLKKLASEASALLAPGTRNPEPGTIQLRTIKLTVAYDGTGFGGWQRQANARSVQAEIEDALAPIEGAAVTVAGAGRTDSGVHALGQVASFRLTNPIETQDLQQALNATLAQDVRVLSAVEAPDGFNARFLARSKLYRYRIYNAKVISPFERHYAWHLSRALDLGAMRHGAAELLGEHDFSSFQAAGGRIKAAIRTITRSDWREDELPGGGRMLVYEVEGTGFLKYMVRSIIGTLIEVGDGRRTPDSLADVLRSRRRAAAGPTAPPHGLYLVRVDYDASGPVSFS